VIHYLPTCFRTLGLQFSSIHFQSHNDACKVLGYADTDKATRTYCKHLKLLKTTKLAGLEIPPRGVMIILESNLHRLIMRSKLPGAERLQDWVFEVVIPAIRKTGSYSVRGEKETIGSVKIVESVGDFGSHFICGNVADSGF
jgi:prophage antirepressor-like protein